VGPENETKKRDEEMAKRDAGKETMATRVRFVRSRITVE